MDFSLLLVVAVAVTGLIWLVDLLWLRPARHRAAAHAEAGTTGGLDPLARVQVLKAPWPVDDSRPCFPVLLVVLVLRSFVVGPFQLPSGARPPPLAVGAFMLVNQFTYGRRVPVVH